VHFVEKEPGEGGLDRWPCGGKEGGGPWPAIGRWRDWIPAAAGGQRTRTGEAGCQQVGPHYSAGRARAGEVGC
jgi:hypothetical protein